MCPGDSPGRYRICDLLGREGTLAKNVKLGPEILILQCKYAADGCAILEMALTSSDPV